MISLKAFSVLLHPGYVLLDDQQQARSSILGLQKKARPLFFHRLRYSKSQQRVRRARADGEEWRTGGRERKRVNLLSFPRLCAEFIHFFR